MIVTALGYAPDVDHATPSSSFLVDDSTLLDCGSGIEILSIERMLSIERVLLTHAHLDHCSGLQPLLACHAQNNGNGITVYSQQESIDVLRQCLFNNELCTNYSEYKNPDGKALLQFSAVEVGDALPLPDGMATALPAQHTVPAIGWLIEGPWRALAYTGDSGPCHAFWHWISHVPSLSDIICELTLPGNDDSQHYTHLSPEQLLPMLSLLPANAHVWVKYLDYRQREPVLTAIKAAAPASIIIGEITSNSVIDL